MNAMTEALLVIAGIIGLFLWSRWLDQPDYGDRCGVCGYLLDGPLHNEEACEAEREARTASPEQLKTEEIHQLNKEELGF